MSSFIAHSLPNISANDFLIFSPSVYLLCGCLYGECIVDYIIIKIHAALARFRARNIGILFI